MTRASKSKGKKSAKATPRAENGQPRQPMRGRGVLRYKNLIEATDALLTAENPDEIGLYQIAARAKVPPASVYHFFPTKEAAFLAVMQSYVDQLAEHHAQPIDASAIRGWQDLAAVDMRRGMQFHNAHPPMMKINYGGYGGVAVRHIDELFTIRIAASQYGRLNKLFHMPPLSRAEQIFEMRLAIIDGIWGISFRRHGEITEYYFQESLNAVIAFMSQFLPPRLEPRDALIAAAARGESIRLPFDPPTVEDEVPAPAGRKAKSKI